MPNPDEPYPPFSPNGERRYESVMRRLGRMVAESARAEARAGHADFVSEDHVDLAVKTLLDKPSEVLPTGTGVSFVLLAPIAAIAGAALLAGLQDWRWANFAVAAAALIVIVLVSLRRRV